MLVLLQHNCILTQKTDWMLEQHQYTNLTNKKLPSNFCVLFQFHPSKQKIIFGAQCWDLIIPSWRTFCITNLWICYLLQTGWWDKKEFGVPISNWRCMMFIIERWRLIRTSAWMHHRRNTSSARRKRSPTSSMGMWTCRVKSKKCTYRICKLWVKAYLPLQYLMATIVII